MKRSIWFFGLIAIMYILVGGILFRGYQIWITNDYLFKEHFDLSDAVMPSWYPSVTLILGFLSFIGITLTFFYKKWGVYLTIASLFLSIVIQPEFMPDGTLYSLFALFVFVGYGLAVIIPNWKKFS
ncbi:MAG: hypothetical protein RBT46_00790 [Weeksellaceae bacterium]|jgi:hypothetical protein|nr:hypothetical protein [Weeksellaceae bacterium]MDX9704230.1 hypothetical protein [Weeksellaceae bacterium]